MACAASERPEKAVVPTPINPPKPARVKAAFVTGDIPGARLVQASLNPVGCRATVANPFFGSMLCKVNGLGSAADLGNKVENWTKAEAEKFFAPTLIPALIILANMGNEWCLHNRKPRKTKKENIFTSWFSVSLFLVIDFLFHSKKKQKKTNSSRALPCLSFSQESNSQTASNKCQKKKIWMRFTAASRSKSPTSFQAY